jgi:hypothetical protein
MTTLTGKRLSGLTHPPAKAKSIESIGGCMYMRLCVGVHELYMLHCFALLCRGTEGEEEGEKSMMLLGAGAPPPTAWPLPPPSVAALTRGGSLQTLEHREYTLLLCVGYAVAAELQAVASSTSTAADAVELAMACRAMSLPRLAGETTPLRGERTLLSSQPTPVMRMSKHALKGATGERRLPNVMG